MLNPYKPPESTVLKNSAATGSLRRKRKFVVLGADCEWPKRCIKCNADTSSFKRLTLGYVNPWFYLTILISILITLVLVLIFQKKFRFDLPLCENHLKKHKKLILTHWILFISSMILLVLSVYFEMTGLMTIAIVVFITLLFSALINRVAYIAKYKQGKIWLVGAKKPFLESLQELE